MSILKSILHRWNKDSKSYDTLHPETEVAQITDWSQGIVNTLASTALGSLISTLSSDSLMAKLMKLVLDASGVKYLIDTNGYVCFGSLFGGLIIQWILSAQENKTLRTPLSCKNKWFEIAIHKTGGTNYTQIAMRDAGPDSLYITTPLNGESNSYWFGIFTN